jgi:lysophospholipase L1-like esterase
VLLFAGGNAGAEAGGLEQWQAEIATLTVNDAAHPPPRDAVVFVGGSSIRLWTTLAKDFPGVPTINRGFGGSAIADSTFYADRIVVPYHPKLIIMYAGDNDIAEGRTSQQVVDDFKAFVARVRRDLPSVAIAYLSIKPSVARAALWPRMLAANQEIARWASAQQGVIFVDVATKMLDANGRPRPDLLREDGLHMRPAGYAIWIDALKPVLLRYGFAPMPKVSLPIVDVQLGTPAYFDYGGDSWDPTWAQDDELYSAVNDGAGFGKRKRNIAFNRISGNDPLALSGRLQNVMEEYGAMNAPVATDGRNWKSGGSIAIDGMLYMSIGMDRYVDAAYAGRQTRVDSSIIKSDDHGLHWSRPMRENRRSPMFPGMRFATPFFIHFGKEYAAATVDNADRYVYATSNDGFWDNGDSYIMGRVARSRISALNAADWEFYTGADGMRDSSWTHDMRQAAHIVDAPGQCGETGVTYLPALNRYVMTAWYYPAGTVPVRFVTAAAGMR